AQASPGDARAHESHLVDHAQRIVEADETDRLEEHALVRPDAIEEEVRDRGEAAMLGLRSSEIERRGHGPRSREEQRARDRQPRAAHDARESGGRGQQESAYWRDEVPPEVRHAERDVAEPDDDTSARGARHGTPMPPELERG